MAEPMNKLQSIRTILECVIVAVLIWTGSSLVEFKTQMAVVQSQLTGIQVGLADVPKLKEEAAVARAERDAIVKQLTDQSISIAELRKLRGMR